LIPQHNPSLSYRPDVDGLRAVAVLAVVIFHAFPGSPFKGGFIGVDVFFVISGFLISSIIFRGIERRAGVRAEGRPFSFAGFYARRVRRIFPSLICALLFCFALGWAVLIPEDFAQLGKHIAGGAGYVSNLVLWSESGQYFDSDSLHKPLLHLWSLGIEEQFYLIWPALLFLAWKLRISLFLIAALGAALSFAFEAATVGADAAGAFYSPLLRFWELMAGSLWGWLALHPAKLRLSDGRRRFIREFAGALGLALVLGASLLMRPEVFPGVKALIPVAGAVMIIAAGADSAVNRWLLSNRVVVFIGLVSYPFYIWHWPLLSFAAIIDGRLPRAGIRAGCVLLALLLSYLTYRVVEPPLRWGRHGGIKALGLLAVMCAIGGAGFWVYSSGGLPERISDPETRAEIEVARLDEQAAAQCALVFPQWRSTDPDNYCKMQRPDGENTLAVIGDSHASQLFPGMIRVSGQDEGVALFSASCAIPLMGLQSGADEQTVKLNPKRAQNARLLAAGFEHILSHPEIRTVVLAHSPLCSDDELKDLEEPKLKDHDEMLRRGFARTFKALSRAGREVVVALDNPTFDDGLYNRCKVAVMLSGIDPTGMAERRAQASCHQDQGTLLSRQAADRYNRIAKEAAREFGNVSFVDLEALLCSEGQCRMTDGKGHMLMRDRSHLNYRGAYLVAPAIMQKARDGK
jgi:peptidoglycan/LPS O-acetylase OafA/YrhL